MPHLTQDSALNLSIRSGIAWINYNNYARKNGRKPLESGLAKKHFGEFLCTDLLSVRALIQVYQASKNPEGAITVPFRISVTESGYQ